MSFFRRIMLSGGMPIDIPESRKIYYTASAKITPDLDYDILTNTWNSSTGEGVIVCKTDITSIGNRAFYWCDNLTSVTIPDSVTALGNLAFYYCTSLTSVTIPDSVTLIGYSSFQYCTSLTNVTIPDSVISIGDYAFEECRNLTNITIPDSVTSIGASVFYNCTSLASITIPESVTSIGNNAFRGCISLTSITIPNNVTSIGEYAFSRCSNLTNVYCKPSTPPTGNSNMFYFNASGRMIYVPRESVDAYKAASYWSTYAADIVAYDFDVDEGGSKLTFPIYLNQGDNGQLITDLYNYLLPKLENEGEYTFTSDEIIYVHDVLVASASILDETRIRLHLSTYTGHDIIDVFIWNDGVLYVALD